MVTKEGKCVYLAFGILGKCTILVGSKEVILGGLWILPVLSGWTAGDFPLVLLSSYFSFLSLPHVTAASLQRQQLIPSLHMAGLSPTHCPNPLTLLLGRFADSLLYQPLPSLLSLPLPSLALLLLPDYATSSKF